MTFNNIKQVPISSCLARLVQCALQLHVVCPLVALVTFASACVLMVASSNRRADTDEDALKELDGCAGYGF